VCTLEHRDEGLMGLRRDSMWEWEMDGTGSVSCTMAGFDISGVGPSSLRLEG
jgi:hypothetical protein